MNTENSKLIKSADDNQVETYKVIEHNDYIVAYKVIANEHSHKLEHEEAHNLLKQVLLDYYQVDVNDLVVAKKEHGKPYFENSDIHYNISHCKGMVACAISRKVELGVDVEGVRPYRENVLRRVFTENERNAFEKAEEKDLFFFKIWTFKESIIKCSGTGLSRDLREIDYFDSSLYWNQYEVLCENVRYILTVATGQ